MPFPDTVEGRDNSFFTSLYRTYLYAFTKTNTVKLCKVNYGVAFCETKANGYVPNGILTKENKLFVADSLGKTVDVYQITEKLDLSLIEKVKIGHLTDNVHYFNGSVYVTGVNKALDYINFCEAAKDNSNSNLPFVSGGVSKVYLHNGKWVAKEIMMQDLISLPSSSVIIGTKMIITSIIDPALLFCELNNE